MSRTRKRIKISRGAAPLLPKHVRIHFDPVRKAFAVLSPERVFWPDEISLDILRRCDGRSTLGAIIADLAAAYNAPEEEVASDITDFLQEWADKLLVRL